MRSPSNSNLPRFIALFAALAALVYVLAQPSAPPESTSGPPLAISLAPSNFEASGGVVPDADPSVPAASEALRHAAVTAPETEEASSF